MFCNSSAEKKFGAFKHLFQITGSDRVYKKAWDLERILEHFSRERGKHFDPSLVDILFENLDEFIAVRDKFKDYYAAKPESLVSTPPKEVPRLISA